MFGLTGGGDESTLICMKRQDMGREGKGMSIRSGDVLGRLIGCALNENCSSHVCLLPGIELSSLS